MPINFYDYLKKNNEFKNMPAITISIRETDKHVTYNKKTTRIDRIAGDIYEDETVGRIIMWANPDYTYEFDIPDGTVIRVPFPYDDVVDEIISKIVERV